MITIDFASIALPLRNVNGKVSVFDTCRKKWVVLTPEEHVRQMIVQYLCNTLNYPAALLAAEKKIMVGSRTKRFDLVMYDSNHMPWMLVECKAPEVMITEATLHQLLNYQRTVKCRYWVLTNGHQTFCADAVDNQSVVWMNELPVWTAG